MNSNQKKKLIRKHVTDMLMDSRKNMILKVDKLLNSGAIDIDSWDPEYKPMILPNSMICAIFESEIGQYNAKGTSYEKHVKKEVRNFQYFI